MMNTEMPDRKDETMLGILANTFMNATRMDQAPPRQTPLHWPPADRFGTRTGAEIEAHLIGRRRY
ncbi:hypothetical protein RTM1035_01480 [Roseovarius sp. TM1035]|jgi:hypothetical protein|nr:hypothetical protein RTM1035_01480 [Roseovarius sp. TM1035]